MKQRENIPLNKKIPDGAEHAASVILFEQKLMERALGTHPNPEEALGWVETHAAKFREIIDVDPTILLESKDSHDTATQNVKVKLYGR